MEQLGLSRFLLNAHLFPEKLQQNVGFLSQPQQKADIFFESEPLGGAGTLYNLRKFLQREEMFFYLNGDSLFFPSDKDQFSLFEEDFFKTGADCSFFVSPMLLQNSNLGSLWCDKDLNLKFVGKKNQLPKGLKNLLPFHFSGLALFKSSLLESLGSSDFDLFLDFINPLLGKKSFKVFLDKGAKILEAGETSVYLQSTQFCLKCLFETENLKTRALRAEGFESKNRESDKDEGKIKWIKKILEECFARFDPEDQIVGLENGKFWSKKLGFPLLAPKSVQGLESLELRGPAVLGSEVNFFGKSRLKDSVLGSQISWNGELNNNIVLKFIPE